MPNLARVIDVGLAAPAPSVTIASPPASMLTGATAVTNSAVEAIWNAWTITFNAGTSSTNQITLVAENVWTHWNVTIGVSSAGTTYTNQVAWNGWIVQGNVIEEQRAQALLRQQLRVQPTPEQLAEWREQERLAKERAERRHRDLLAARQRARSLLVSCLSPEQREDLAQKKCFFLECHSPDGAKRRYRIDQGTHGNVKLVDDAGKILGSYCVQPDNVPDEDAMLAQKLWLETNEDEFKRRANFRRWA